MFCRGGFFLFGDQYFWLLVFFSFWREKVLDVFQKIEWKKKGKRELSNKNKNTFQIVYIFPYPPHPIRIPKVGYTRYIG